MKSNIAFGTNSRKALPFTVAGLTFFAHPLTVNEDLIFSDLADRYDLEALSNAQAADFMGEQIEGLATLLRSRLQGTPETPLDAAWVGQHISTATFQTILAFLRSGTRPSSRLDIQDWGEEPFTVQDRAFQPRQFSFAEQQQAAGLGFEGTNREILESGLGFLADALNARALDEGTVTADWLRENLASEDVTHMITYLQSGPEALEDPNADEEVTPEADAGAAESDTSAA